MIGDKWKYGAIPSLLIHGSIGTVYCWSLLAAEIEKNIIGDSTWAFSLAIFFLGISAAFLGPIVEKNVKKSALLSTIFFGTGMILSGVACKIGSLPLLYLSYGVIMGIGLGLGYLTPVKTLMLWFKNRKGLATGLAITGFGLAKVFAAPGFSYFIREYDIETLFIFHGILYSIIMLIAVKLIRKPKDAEINLEKLNLSVWFNRIKEAAKVPGLWVYWLIFYLNITAGLAIISYEEFFFSAAGYSAIGLGFCLSMSAVFNSAGRFGAASWSDSFENRGKMFGIILSMSVIICILGFLIPGLIPFAVLICNAGYGAMFSTMPCILSDRYGMKNASEVHGVVLSAWAFAGLTGNQLASIILTIPESTHQTLILMTGVIYSIGLYFSIRLWNNNLAKKSPVEKALNS